MGLKMVNRRVIRQLMMAKKVNQAILIIRAINRKMNHLILEINHLRMVRKAIMVMAMVVRMLPVIRARIIMPKIAKMPGRAILVRDNRTIKATSKINRKMNRLMLKTW